MITKIKDGLVMVTSNGRQQGMYSIDSFSFEELEEQKYIVLGALHSIVSHDDFESKCDVLRGINQELSNRINQEIDKERSGHENN